MSEPATHSATCRHCGRPVIVEIVFDLASALKPVVARLTRIDHILTKEGRIMSEIDDRLAAIKTQFDTFTTDLGRALADLTATVGGKLTDAERADFDAIAQQLTDATLAVDTADPPVPPVV